MDERQRHQRVKEIFFAAVELAADEREAFVAAECGGDRLVFEEVLSFLRLDAETAEEFIDRPASAQLGELVNGDASGATIKDDEHEPVPVWTGLPGTARDVQVDPRSPKMALAERLLPGEVIDGGGMAVIRRSTDVNLLRTAAMKVLRRRHFEEEAVRRRLIEEAQIMAQLDHPNIVPVHELGIDKDNNLFFTMKLVSGRNLRRLLGEQDLSTRTNAELFELLQVFLKICDAISFANSRGVIHRDIKPENIMVGEFGEVYVMDWGIALLKEQPRPSEVEQRASGSDGTPEDDEVCEEYAIAGTPGYMAPEQLTGDISAISVRTDVYSLGAILYMILTLEPPHVGMTLHERLLEKSPSSVKHPQEIVELELPPKLCEIAMKALNHDPDDRHSSARQLKQEVEVFLRSAWQLDQRDYPAGTYIICEGEAGNEAYIIAKGRCQATKLVDGKEVVLREMGPGEVFGETAVLTEEPRTAAVRTLDQVTVAVITREQFNEEMGTGRFLGRFIKTLAERFREKDNQTTLLLQELSEGSLASWVLEQMAFDGKRIGEGRLTASWSRLCEALAERADREPAEIARMVERLDQFQINRRADTISYDRHQMR
jgi:serine/threonine-protein kinase